MPDRAALNPSAALLAKLGSIIVHADEATQSDGHAYDVDAIRSLLGDPEVAEWLDAMAKMALLPVKRDV